ncbi:Hypothetical protein R9X50_00006800 [Acrodontium crateriforme]|uniref:Uncharacterized protein n=1 Tax=Acrodontium crateriforme TaxID=150365 RepID=A0AAQ3LWS9_9PEZI|nr:Hypothetical protein R9X50_00006800 [Acrodontium crateriforme]
MALDMMVGSAPPSLNGGLGTPSSEDNELYTKLLHLRDKVVAGQHARIKLSASAMKQLSATNPPLLHGPPDSRVSLTTNQQNTQALPGASSLPGLGSSATYCAHDASRSTYGVTQAAAGLDPIFLEKSDSLVRAEGQLKRQRIERDLQAQVDQRKAAPRDKDVAADGPSRIDVDSAFFSALKRVKHLSGLKLAHAGASPANSSFDENDYYSSQVESEWSSDASASKESDKDTGAFLIPNVRPGARDTDGPPEAFTATASNRVHGYDDYLEDGIEMEGEDDEYTPPDASAFDIHQDHGMASGLQQITPPEDEDSEYEPGDITQDSNNHTPYNAPYQASPQVPIIRNHLTHIAAPQPNRVSPLATAKGPSIELELVNGRPEVVQKSLPRSAPMHSRPSSASPSANGGSGKKLRNKKRKRDNDMGKRAKKRRDKQANQAAGQAQSPESPDYREPFIKDEPVSPPPFGNIGEIPPYQQGAPQYAEVDLVSPRRLPTQYSNEPARSNLRYEYVQPLPPGRMNMTPLGSYRPAQRNTRDLRRIASHQYAMRLSSPESGGNTPSTRHRAISYGQEPIGYHSSHRDAYREIGVDTNVQYVRKEPAPSPPRLREYRDPYTSGEQSPAPMAPPAPRRVVVDQNGNRYYAADPASAYVGASVAPLERRPLPEMPYDRSASQLSVAYGQPPAPQYDPTESHMAAPQILRAPVNDQPVEYIDSNGYRVRDYSARPRESVRYIENTSPLMYENAPRYDMAPPLLPPTRDQTSSVFAPPRAYSTRPDTMQPPSIGYNRHTSIAPVQYARQDIPPQSARAVSVMPGGINHGAPLHQQPYGYAPQAPAPPGLRYVDQYGQEVFAGELRQAGEYRYQ